MATYPEATRTETGPLAEAATFLALARSDRATVRAALGLAGIAGLLVLVNVVLHALDGRSALAAALLTELDLSAEGALAERYLQGVSFVTAALFAVDHLARGGRITAFLAALYLFIWFDDAALYHERLGSVLAGTGLLPGLPGLRLKDSGEMLAWALAAIAFACLLPWAWRGRRKGDPGIVALVAASFAALVVFAVAFDMVHMMLPNRLGTLVGILEDGGEMVAISAAAIVALGLTRFGRRYREAW